MLGAMRCPRRARPLAVAALLLTACTSSIPGNEAIVCGSETKGVGAGCEASYSLCKGGIYRVACDPSGGGVKCTYVENGNAAKSFQSDDACNVSPDTLKKRASSGCGWVLD